MSVVGAKLALLADVLDFWFGDVAEDRPFDRRSVEMRRWYGKEPGIDTEIRRKFEPLYEDLRGTGIERLGSGRSVRDLTAKIIVLDQFPRNMYRDTPRMYESDEIALGLAEVILEHSAFRTLDLFQQLFALLPFMHAEGIEAQRIIIANFQRFQVEVRERNLPNNEFFVQAMDFARRHHDIVECFGRFPHRNSILGRKSTPEEIRFLEQPDSRF